MLGPAISGTPRTPDLMAEAGLIYHTDWMHDDQPVPIRVASGKLVSVLANQPQAMLQRLPPDQRLAIILCDLQGFDYREIADVMDMSVWGVADAVQRGLNRLRRRFASHRVV